MNHKDANLRAEMIAAAIVDGVPMSRLAYWFDVGASAIVNACRKFGVPLPRTRRPAWRAAEKWLSVDWNKQDVELSAEIGVSRERIRQMRNKMGIPKSENQHHIIRLTREQISLLGAKPDCELAEMFGCSTKLISARRSQLRIPKCPNPRTFQWPDWAIKKMGHVPDQAIANELGIHLMTVNKKRRELGIQSRTELEGTYHSWPEYAQIDSEIISSLTERPTP